MSNFLSTTIKLISLPFSLAMLINGGLSLAQTNTETRFTCQDYNGQYTVMYNPENQPEKYYPWATPGELGDGWSSYNRCEEISRRLESYRPDGLLTLSVGVENNYEIVCATTQKDPSCRIVFTVPPGQNALLTRDLVFQNLIQADNGQITDGVNTWSEANKENNLFSELGQLLNIQSFNRNNSNQAINLRPFLSPGDGGSLN
jgi:hypothetical protein